MAFSLQKKMVGHQTSTTDSGAYSLFTAAHKKKNSLMIHVQVYLIYWIS